MKITFGLLVLIILIALMRFGWELHPWIRAGQSVYISNNRIGDYDFQVWQRKNDSIFEPFTTGLFIRKSGGQWQAFWLGIQDSYNPKIVLRKENFGFAVFSDSDELGVLSESIETFKQKSSGASFPAAILNGEPPGNWWFK